MAFFQRKKKANAFLRGFSGKLMKRTASNLDSQTFKLFALDLGEENFAICAKPHSSDLLLMKCDERLNTLFQQRFSMIMHVCITAPRGGLKYRKK